MACSGRRPAARIPGPKRFLALGSLLLACADGSASTKWVSLPPISPGARSLLVLIRHEGGVAAQALDAQRILRGDEVLSIPRLPSSVRDELELFVAAYPVPLEALHLAPGPLLEGNDQPERLVPEPLQGFWRGALDGAWEERASLPSWVSSRRVELRSPIELGNRRVREVRVGHGFSCALRRDGEVACWGQNEQGELGRPLSPPAIEPVEVKGVEGISSLRIGSSSVCGLQPTGGIVCWGGSGSGQLGRGPVSDGSVPLPVVGIQDAVDVGVGSVHTCALRASGKVACWGSNKAELGMVGAGPHVDVLEPLELTGLPPAVELAVGSFHSCARLIDGEVRCWGMNHLGQRGTGPATLEPSAIEALGAPVDLVSGGEHLCARLEDESVWCWGANHSGQLGSQGAPLVQPSLVRSELSDVPGRLIAGGSATCAFQPEAGALACVGASVSLDLGGLSDPIRDPGLGSRASDIALGGQHACMVEPAGGVACWGASGSGQLGSLPRPVFPEPVEIPEIDDAIRVKAGPQATCVFRSDGWPWCTGSNVLGVVDIDAGSAVTRPLRHRLRAAEIELEGAFACALTSTAAQSLLCFGQNDVAQLGRGEITEQELEPGPVIGLERPIDFSLGDRGVGCAVTGAGELWCWGTNEYFQLGTDQPGDVRATTPVRVPLDAVVSVAVGASHACAIAGPERAVFCWGTNRHGQLGIGSSGNTPSPVRTQLSGVVELAAGDNHNCARLGDGKLSCWGRNSSGECGDSDADKIWWPTVVPGISDPVALALGAAHSCLLRADATMVCFGSNRAGQLGRGTAGEERGRPAPVPGLSGVVSIAAGIEHSCAVRQDGRAFCWGLDSWGQLGIGTKVVVDEPTPVTNLP